MALALAMASGFVESPTAAWAHSHLERTNPADGATVESVLGEVTLTFNEVVKTTFSTVVVTGPSGRSYSRGELHGTDATIHQPLYRLNSGTYTVAWRVVSADGHPVSGHFGFTVRLGPANEPTGLPPLVAAAVSPAGAPLGWWLVAAAVVAAAGLAASTGWAHRRYRRRTG